MLVATPLAFMPSAQAQQLPETATVYSSVSVRVDDVSKSELFDFVTDLENDKLWFPGILSSDLVETGPNGGPVGNIYNQVAIIDAQGTTAVNDIKVLAEREDRYFIINSDGNIADYYAIYTFRSSANGGGVWTLWSKYEAPGLTEETFTQFIEGAFYSLLEYYGSTGKVRTNFLLVVD